MEDKKLQNVNMIINGCDLDFDLTKQLSECIALRENESALLVSWNDRDNKIHSPQSLQCEIKGDPGWEVYGRNHGGRLRIGFNEDQFVFIYS